MVSATGAPFCGNRVCQAKAAGFKIDDAVFDNGTSGVSTRLIERKEGRRLFDKLRRSDVLVVRWVDRLGRNYDDVCGPSASSWSAASSSRRSSTA